MGAQDWFNKTNPIISLEQKVTGEFPERILDSQSFPISVSVTANSNTGISKPNYFKYFISLRSGPTVNPDNEEFFELTKCAKENFPRISQDDYDDLGINKNMCIKNQNFTLSGSWGSSDIAYLAIRMTMCINSTSEDSCAPMEEIIDFIKSNTYYFNLYFQNTYVNPESSTLPVTYKLFNYAFLIRPDSFKYLNMFVRGQSLSSDEGFLTKSLYTNDSLANDYIQYDETFLDSSFTLIEFDIQVSANYFIYHRSYIKLQTVLANIGGIGNLLNILFLSVCYIFSIVKRNSIIMNKIFDFDLSFRANDNSKFEEPKFSYEDLCNSIRNNKNITKKTIENLKKKSILLNSSNFKSNEIMKNKRLTFKFLIKQF